MGYVFLEGLVGGLKLTAVACQLCFENDNARLSPFVNDHEVNKE